MAMIHLRNVATAGIIGAAGDTAMQAREGAAVIAQIDTARTARLVSFRMLHAPLVDAAWRFFDRKIPFRGAAGVAARVAADQGLLMPPSLVGFFLSQSALEGRSLDESLARVQHAFVPAATKALPYWCSVHTLTFSVIPPRFRMAWASLCAVAWNAMMSNENQLAIKSQARRQTSTTQSDT